MCCAWSPAGDLVAGVFQDGLAALWDFRSGKVRAMPAIRPRGFTVQRVAAGPDCHGVGCSHGGLAWSAGVLLRVAWRHALAIIVPLQTVATYSRS